MQHRLSLIVSDCSSFMESFLQTDGIKVRHPSSIWPAQRLHLKTVDSQLRHIEMLCCR